MSLNPHPLAQFDRPNSSVETFGHGMMSEGSGSHFESGSFFDKSHKKGSEQQTHSNIIALNSQHAVFTNITSTTNDVGMIVENEETQQPDLSEIIRSLDTPPPSAES